MSSTSRAWIAAASIGVVEALKDQGVCRWNSALRSIQHHTKTNLRSYSQAKKIPASQYVSNNFRDDKLKQSEESLRTVMSEVVVLVQGSGLRSRNRVRALCLGSNHLAGPSLGSEFRSMVQGSGAGVGPWSGLGSEFGVLVMVQVLGSSLGSGFGFAVRVEV
ncbi:hypothetical protein G4B88_015253 [Cannabis sativa]|uniref:Wound-responsive family protein n=1 Tax=Cannabis sativa TaxID=3483 RepID=A0A7J6DK27_CANSA|nr:hypothetical protein G4B88_015253 [Cannabis sativa]